MDAESILTLGSCNPILSLSFGSILERTLTHLFPPALKPMDSTELHEVMDYQYRISRRGLDRNPIAYAGIRIVSVTEGCSPPKLKRGTAASRLMQRG